MSMIYLCEIEVAPIIACHFNKLWKTI